MRVIAKTAYWAILLAFIAGMVWHEDQLGRSRPHRPDPAHGYTIEIATKTQFGFGQVETIYISERDSRLRIGAFAVWIGYVFGAGYLMKRFSKAD